MPAPLSTSGLRPWLELFVRSLLGVGSVHAVAIFTGTVFALSASRDSGRRVAAALSFLFFLRPPFRASQSFLLLALLKR